MKKDILTKNIGMKLFLFALVLILISDKKEDTYGFSTTNTTNTTNTKSTEVKLEEVKVLSDSSTKSYMPLEKITDKTSPQWKYISSLPNITIKNASWNGVFRDRFFPKDNGQLLIIDGEYIGVALGTYFGNIGSKWIFELDSGIKIKTAKIDEKDKSETDKNGFYHLSDGSVIEFVVNMSSPETQKNVKPNGYVWGGNFNNCDAFKGKIVRIWKVIE